ncbi:hypothetical protein ZIOFF_044639 [Zingiber officinale]|uniref:C3HC-type domain-containing protein n=1 Tax=Zingiber officinale TaxID=94328 RepID=A0A8J5KXG9_ZINOF|nr:hypothetical protein ZIOFF_044639 [Zingiber officinale]
MSASSSSGVSVTVWRRPSSSIFSARIQWKLPPYDPLPGHAAHYAAYRRHWSLGRYCQLLPLSVIGPNGRAARPICRPGDATAGPSSRSTNELLSGSTLSSEEALPAVSRLRSSLSRARLSDRLLFLLIVKQVHTSSLPPSPRRPDPSHAEHEHHQHGGGGNRTESGSSGSFGRGVRVPSSSLGSIAEAPSCRPWDREDLMKRLATFKAMTWFGKPKVINPVNCARRGWINVEMEVIACESCGARLLFPTPSSWSLQQVEKAAAVFSLELNNRHKLLCPWIDNACDETLALFPPTPPQSLIESYNMRSCALLKLSALPLISSSAMDYMKMKNPQLENFLSEPPHYPINFSKTLKIVDGSADQAVIGSLTFVNNVWKIICLCGWEPRLLPYVVDCQDLSNPLTQSAPTPKSSLQLHGEQNDGLAIYSRGIESIESATLDVAQDSYDPASSVLECKFCGACVALWAIETVQRPLELYTVLADSSDQNESITSSMITSKADTSGTINSKLETFDTSRGSHTLDDGSGLKERSPGLNLTIAGGPPPATQNFQPRVSFPIISRHLRTQFISSKHEKSFRDQANSECLQVEDCPLRSENEMTEGLIIPDGPGLLKRKRNENENLSGNNEDNAITSFKGEIAGASSSSGANNSTNEEGVTDDGNLKNQVGIQNVLEVSQGNKEDTVDREASYKTLEIAGEAASTKAIDTQNCSEIELVEEQDNGTKFNNDILTSESIPHNLVPNSGDLTASVSATDAAIASACANIGNGKRSTGIQYYQASQFDPIRQHRPYCPWVAPEDGEAMPGWRLTLAALVLRKKELLTSREETSSTLLDDVDDPVVSVRKLFMSPRPKRPKGAH